MTEKVLTLVTEVLILLFKLVGYLAVGMYYCSGLTYYKRIANL